MKKAVIFRTVIMLVLLVLSFTVGCQEKAEPTPTSPPPTVQAPETSPEPKPAPVSPAEFEVSSLSVTPAQIIAGEEAIVEVEVSNVGEAEGTYAATLVVNGSELEEKEVTLGGGETEMVSFTLVEDNIGACNIEINGQTVILTVLKPAELIIYRERLLQLKVFYEQRDEPIGLGRSFVKLANVEQHLGNFEKMEEYAREAEVYADQIPLALRISYHSDLGFFLIIDHPEDGLDHFFQAFDAGQGFPIERQRNLALYINYFIPLCLDEIDHDKYLRKVQQVLRTTNDAEIQSLFQEILDLLTPATN